MEQDQKLNLTSEQQVWFNKIRPQVKEFIEEIDIVKEWIEEWRKKYGNVWYDSISCSYNICNSTRRNIKCGLIKKEKLKL